MGFTLVVKIGKKGIFQKGIFQLTARPHLAIFLPTNITGLHTKRQNAFMKKQPKRQKQENSESALLSQA